MITIDAESKERIQLPLDLDNFCKRYKTANLLYTFTSPSLYTLNKNYFYLLRNSVQKNFDIKYRMKPSYLSYDEYGTVILENVLMFINGVYCIEDFDLNTVIVPDISAIIEITKDKVSDQTTDEMETISW